MFTYEGFTEKHLGGATEIVVEYRDDVVRQVKFKIGPCRHVLSCGDPDRVADLIAFWKGRRKEVREVRLEGGRTTKLI